MIGALQPAAVRLSITCETAGCRRSKEEVNAITFARTQDAGLFMDAYG